MKKSVFPLLLSTLLIACLSGCEARGSADSKQIADPWIRRFKTYDYDYHHFGFTQSIDGVLLGKTPLEGAGKWARSLKPGTHRLTTCATGGLTKKTNVNIQLWSGPSAPIYFRETLGSGVCNFGFMNDGSQDYVQMGKQDVTCPVQTGNCFDLEFVVSAEQPGAP